MLKSFIDDYAVSTQKYLIKTFRIKLFYYQVNLAKGVFNHAY